MHLKFCAVFLLIFCYYGVNADILNKGEGTSLVLGVVTCAFRNEPNACLRSHLARALDVGDRVLEIQTEQLKVDADNELEQRIQSRAISSQDIPKQKPSVIMESYQSVISTLGDYIADEIDDYLTDKTKLKKKQIKTKSDGEEPTDYSVDVEGHDIVDISGDDDKDNKHGVNLNHFTHGEIINKNINNNNNNNDEFSDDNENEDDEHVNGRSNGELRGKKKKKKKALMKLLILGAVIKGKIELLLKLLSAHLQIKFFGIALIGLLLNIVRFWIDLKKAPPKVIYYEHAQHQHHYEDHGDDGWGSSGSSGGGYWKRSLDEQQQENANQYGQWQQPQQQQQQEQQPQQSYQQSNQWRRSFNSGSYFGIPIPLSIDGQNLAYSQQKPINA